MRRDHALLDLYADIHALTYRLGDKLKRSTTAYDRKVAGIVSGANGIQPGICMIQEEKLEAGENVALSGRVYVKAEASTGRMAYLFGNAKFGGWWYYFPVKLLSKVSPALLVLAGVGLVATGARFRTGWSWALYLLLVSALSVLLRALTGT